MLDALEPDYEIEIDAAIFNPIYYPQLDNMSRIQIYFGGASSGKSHFVVGQRVIIDLLKGGRNYMICRQVGKTIKKSVFNQITRTILDFGVSELFSINKTEFTITCANGYQVFFVGLDDVQKIKSIIPERGEITDIIVEEATETDRNTIKALKKRQRGGRDDIPKRLVLLFNPILQDHWIYDEYFAPIAWEEDQTIYESEELFILRTWFEHNQFLTEQDKADLLNETDKYYSDVYTWGKFGVLGNVIFKYGSNWVIEDLSNMRNQFTNRRHGCDFGFASDPAAVVSSHYDKKKSTIYIYNEFYERELTNNELATQLLNMFGGELVICDSSEPKSIRELQGYRVNADGARKGQDSVIHGIQWLRGQKIVIDKACVKSQFEFRSYKWKEDDTGKPVSPPRPVDKNNHIIDALRYAYEEDTIEQPVKGRSYKG